MTSGQFVKWPPFFGPKRTESKEKSANLGAFALAVEPRLMVAITRRIFLQASAAAGLVLKGIAERIQSVETQSLSGTMVSANLAGVFAF